MGDEFVAIIMTAFDQTPVLDAVAEARKQAATAYCKQLENSQDGWLTCVRKLVQYPDGETQLKFWCLEVILQMVNRRYDALSEADRLGLQQALMVYTRDVVAVKAMAPPVKNKLAVLFVRLLKHDYPERWPTFFHDFLGILTKGPQVVDVFLRVLKIIDEEVTVG